MASQSTHEDNKTAIDQMNKMLEGALDENRRHRDTVRRLAMPKVGKDAPSTKAPAQRAPRGLAQRVTTQYFAQQENYQQHDYDLDEPDA